MCKTFTTIAQKFVPISFVKNDPQGGLQFAYYVTQAIVYNGHIFQK